MDDLINKMVKIEEYVKKHYKSEVDEDSNLSVFLESELDLLEFLDGIETLFDTNIDETQVSLQTTIQQLAEMI